ncbi:MAG: ABC transporter permease [Flavobacteriales bacterium]|nr:ABC transporter permease [Flavobacteriales bacterium]MBT7726219.1 ABC transporter permease [Flavobacteriales bacterium]
MNKIWLIIKREYSVRVRKKSFIVMTILGPILMAALFIVPTYLSIQGLETQQIVVSEKGNFFSEKLEDNELVQFSKIPEMEIERLKKNFGSSPYYALLIISDSNSQNRFTIYSAQHISLSVKNNIESQISKINERKKLEEADIDIEILNSLFSEIEIMSVIIDEQGDESKGSSEMNSAIGFITAFLIYLFIFMYGSMVMRGVIEEKTSRIVEVIISSVRPFQLMMGKIVGVALVGLTQFVLWILLTYSIASLFEVVFMNSNNQSEIITGILSSVGQINLSSIVISFLFYFIGGYLLYSSLFAAIGSAVDTESDTQQFVLPITIPLILSLVMIEPIMNNPDGTLAIWLSIIPFSSPIIMMVRLPFGGVENWEIIISATVLICTFLSTTYIASKIYRVGILMYGKKSSFKELIKWISYKD